VATRIAVIGAGALGTSLGLALKASNRPLEVIGHDRKLERAQAAHRRGAFDRVEWNLINAVGDADLVILALPLGAIEETLRHIGPELHSNSVVTDTASIKESVLTWAGRLLPHDVHFIGGDPLVQTPGYGPDAGRGDLFQQRRYVLTPLADTDSQALSLVTSVVTLLGAEPLFMEAAEHDGLAAAVNQLPTALSLILLKATTEHPAWREMSKMAGSAYADSTRLPSEEAPELRSLLMANREGLERWLTEIQRELESFQQLLASGDREALEALLVDLLVARARWAESQENVERANPAMEEVSRRSMLGGFLGLRPFGRKRDKK